MVQKTIKTTPVSAVLPLSDLLFLLRGQLQGSVSVRSINQWHHYTSVHLAIFDHLWVFEIVSGLNGIIIMCRIQYSNTQQQFLSNLNFITYNYYELTYKLQNI